MVDYLQFKKQFRQLFEESWLYQLYRTRNLNPYEKGLVVGSMLFGAEQLLFKGVPVDVEKKQSGS